MQPVDLDPLFVYPIYREDLPVAARDLVDLIGWHRTRDLVREMGGVAFPVPKGRSNNRDGEARYEYLVELVGEEAAETLIQAYRGSKLHVPVCLRAGAIARQRHMQARYDQGATLGQLASEFHVTERWLSIILKKPLSPVGEPL